ncbi:MAG: hypothetical protein DHS20C12_18880 [Pseudohongiella sp.]|nr:MAG: hypothetical protein DHS20C12_18880 [Pseudohongiella sp.]
MNDASELFVFSDATSHSCKVDEWLSGDPPELHALARKWFEVFRSCGDDVDELIHDGCPTACVDGAAFGYIDVFNSHVNIGFYMGAVIADPSSLLEGSGKRMRHVKCRPNSEPEAAAIDELIRAAYTDMRSRVAG